MEVSTASIHAQAPNSQEANMMHFTLDILSPSNSEKAANHSSALEPSNGTLLREDGQPPSKRQRTSTLICWDDLPTAYVRSWQSNSGDAANSRDTPKASAAPSAGTTQKEPISPLPAPLASSSSSPGGSRPAETKRPSARFRPRSSIPSRLSTITYGQQCVAAAYASRLNPYALHRKEQHALQDHLCHLHVTVYLNIRNGILRLWTRNPMLSVTREEALGCAKDYRWINLASFAYEWLVRNGYINFGCVEMPGASNLVGTQRLKESRPVVVVVGAGMSGLGCARHLENFFQYYGTDASPRVILLEGRRRIGGRIYSHPLQSLESRTLPPGLRPKAEMGAQIVVGFGKNPLDQVIRGQLGLYCHFVRDISTIYDVDGSPVHEVQDAMDEMLYNDILDRSGAYRHHAVIVPTAEGDRELIDSGRESYLDDGLTVREYEEARAAGTVGLLRPGKRLRRRGVGHKTAEIRPAGPSRPDTGNEEHPAALACRTMGWNLKSGVSLDDSLNLDSVAKGSQAPSLGAVMEEGIKQYQRMLPLTPKDMRLLNWHFANLEYANAANVGDLSLSGWDQDMGNEFEGEHSQIIGGYGQVPYGVWSFPAKLDVRRNKTVSKISYDPSGKQQTVIQCDDGESFSADKVVFTGSLGVLKHQDVEFEPSLPDWKTDAIDRLGFGVMNKVVLVFDEPFWDTERDMFGLLHEPSEHSTSIAQEDYSANRGRCYLFWNCLKTTGIPVLIGLMAGDAAYQTERTSDSEIITDAVSQLRSVFRNVAVPDPLESIISRWGTDKFTRGSYSFVAPEARPGDYDLMAEPVGNLYFAGEATCGTHPATVHGAYLSGLRAAAEVIESLVGPIEIPQPLVPEKNKVASPPMGALTGPGTPTVTTSRLTAAAGDKPSEDAPSLSNQEKEKRAYNQEKLAAVYAEIGEPEPPPRRPGIDINGYLLYQKYHWHTFRAQYERTQCAAGRRMEDRRMETNSANPKAAHNEVRHALGQQWRALSKEAQRPYLEEAEANQRRNAENVRRWKHNKAEWDKNSLEIRARWSALNPFEEWVRIRKTAMDAAASIVNGSASSGSGSASRA